MSTINVPTTLGSMLIGGFFASMLSGIVCIQTMLYFRTYKTDGAGVKSLVFAVCFLDLLHTAFIWIAGWIYVIEHWGSTPRLDFIPWCISLTVIITALVTFLVHCFFAHRIFLLSKRNWYMATPVVLFALLRLVAASVSTAEMLHYKSFHLFVVHARWIFTLGLSVSSAVDILITGFLFYLFQESRTEGGHLNHVIDKLMLYAFETGSLTCLGTVVSLICWITMPSNLVFLGLHFAIGKLYANSLLVTLNTRDNIRRARSTTSGERGPGVLFLETRPNKESTSASAHASYFAGPSKTEVQINVERSVQYDLGDRASIESNIRK
ncbi:hypothetical protein C8F01DRAFT_657816 [Mycena amicta]|nr:hypothetical protein C8F01DRAFT_657816 [Mycena amicta]